jgi:hypothetical protein
MVRERTTEAPYPTEPEFFIRPDSTDDLLAAGSPFLKFLRIGLGIIIAVGLYLSSLYSYLLFHTLAELFSIVVACAFFFIAWNCRGFLTNNYLLFIGIAYLFVAGLDLMHTIAYEGMGVFPQYGANLAPQLWIAGRFLESLALLSAPLFLKRRPRLDILFAGWSAVFAAVIASIFYWRVFPVCWIDGVGLTTFKKVSEYVICSILAASIAVLLRRRDYFEPRVLKLILWSILCTIGAELAFTFYVKMYAFSNLVGHYFKIASFYLIYKAIIETGLREPFALLFMELKREQEALKRNQLAIEANKQALARSVALLDDTQEIARVGGWEYDLETGEYFCTKELCRILEAPLDCARTPEQGHEFCAPDFMPQLHDAPQKAVLEGETFDLELPLITALGNSLWARAILKPHRIDGKTVKLSCSLQDITERKLMAERQSQLMEEIKHFAYIVSHDLRAPLINIKGFTDELENAAEVVRNALTDPRTAFHEERKAELSRAAQQDMPEAMKYIRLAVSRMNHLINAILNLAKLERRELEFELLDMREIVTQTVGAMSYQIAQSGAELTIDQLPPATADRIAMEQIIGNLVDNAVKYLAPGRPGKIEITGKRLSAETIFEVRDNGSGIDKPEQSQIFEIFQRGKRDDVPGEGLGLAYVRTLVRRHGGRIWCESEPGKWTRFVFTLSNHLSERAEAS